MVRVLAESNINVFLRSCRPFPEKKCHQCTQYGGAQPCRLAEFPRHSYPHYDAWGLWKLLALEDVGTATPEDMPIDTQMESALTCVHSAGYVHGDII